METEGFNMASVNVLKHALYPLNMYFGGEIAVINIINPETSKPDRGLQCLIP